MDMRLIHPATADREMVPMCTIEALPERHWSVATF
jgi:hypothetical protein